jgi:hypothetical protein
MSATHKTYFMDLYAPNEARLREFAGEAAQSREDAAAVERASSGSFEQYLADYLA